MTILELIEQLRGIVANPETDDDFSTELEISVNGEWIPFDARDVATSNGTIVSETIDAEDAE